MGAAPSWYNKKKYAHFDLPCSGKVAELLATNPRKVATHSFFPFISFDIKRRRYKARNGKAEVSTKKRPIKIASHRDGYIFAYYASLLSQKYDAFIKGTALDPCVLAYRKGLGSNIQFASAAFDEVDRRGACAAIAIDLESFFDSINHAELKRQWVAVLGSPKLPDDHWAVFRALTRHAWVEREDCYAALGIDPDKDIPKPLCPPADFRLKIRKAGLIRENKNDYGIPQGAAISAVLSNIFMIRFDTAMQSIATSIGGYYRRYCDDILWIVDKEHLALVQDSVEEHLKTLGPDAKVNRDKTVVSIFQAGTLQAGSKPFQYLGFVYDGERRLIRSQTCSKYWRKVVYAVRAAKRRAKKSAIAPGVVFRRKLYRRLSHLGKRNFIRYARNAEKVMESGDIKRQIRRHWQRIHKELEKPI